MDDPPLASLDLGLGSKARLDTIAKWDALGIARLARQVDLRGIDQPRLDWTPILVTRTARRSIALVDRIAIDADICVALR